MRVLVSDYYVPYITDYCKSPTSRRISIISLCFVFCLLLLYSSIGDVPKMSEITGIIVDNTNGTPVNRKLTMATKKHSNPPMRTKTSQKHPKSPVLTKTPQIHVKSPVLIDTPQNYLNFPILIKTSQKNPKSPVLTKTPQKHLNSQVLLKKPQKQFNSSSPVSTSDPFLTTFIPPSDIRNPSSRVAFLTSLRPKKLSIDCNRPWVTFIASGRLGNQMCEYAHLLLMYLDHGIQVGLHSTMQMAFVPIFPHLSLDILPDKCLEFNNIQTHPWSNIDTMISKGRHTLNGQVVLWGTPCNSTRLWKYRHIWREEFTFATTISKKAKANIQRSLDLWRNKRGVIQSQGPVVVGVHVRRTDYIEFIRMTTGDKIIQEEYFINAFRECRKRYGEVAFLLTSDDRNWCQMMLKRHNITDVVVAPDASSTVDLALLSMSSHLIMSVGTYGFWAGALSRGMVIFPQNVGVRNEYWMTKNLELIHSSDLIPLSV